MKSLRFTLLLCVLVLSACSGSSNMLYGNLSQQDANKIIMTLGNNAINASKRVEKDGSYTVMVSSKDMLSALNLMRDHSGPHQEFQTLGEIFKKDGYISSPTEEHERLIFALNQEISAMLSELNGVSVAKVEVSIPTSSDSLIDSETAKPVAAVLIKYQRGERLDSYINRIKRLVSHSVAGLSPDQVEVITVEQKNDN